MQLANLTRSAEIQQYYLEMSAGKVKDYSISDAISYSLHSGELQCINITYLSILNTYIHLYCTYRYIHILRFLFISNYSSPTILYHIYLLIAVYPLPSLLLSSNFSSSSPPLSPRYVEVSPVHSKHSSAKICITLSKCLSICGLVFSLFKHPLNPFGFAVTRTNETWNICLVWIFCV